MMELRIIKFIGISLVLLFGRGIYAQDNNVYRTFPETRIVNGHSVETNQEGVLKFIISHRFAEINTGLYDFFGLDDANMRLGLDYGVNNWATIGIGRSSFEKTYDGYLKTRILRQKTGDKSFPLTMTYFGSIAYKSLREEDPDRQFDDDLNLFYVHQLLIAHKFSHTFSLQVMPSLVHRNLVETNDESHDVIAIGVAPRMQLSKKWSVNVEYYYPLPDQLKEGLTESLSIGFDIETKGHVFQFSFGNSRGLIEKMFITETTGEWGEGDIHFGFNITRDFKLKGRKYRN